jgi:DNA-binding beta-propeller fold protein YncE
MKNARATLTTVAAMVLPLGLAPAAQAQPAPTYTVTKTVPLGGPDRWDYVVFDPGSGRVYVAHADRVDVVDGRDGKLIGKIEGIAGGTHGFGISAKSGQGFTDDGEAGTAVAFDLKTLKIKARIPVQKDADAVALDPATGHVFIIEGDAHTITAIDPKTDKVISNIDGGGGLEYAVPDGRGHLFVNGAKKREILSVNTRTNALDGRWAVPDCASPHGMAIDAAAHRLFTSCVNGQMVILNTDTGAIVATVPIGAGTDAAAFDPVRKLAFSSNGISGTITVIAEKDANTFVPVATIKTALTGRTMSLDPKTGRLYIAAGEINLNPAPGQPRMTPGSLRLLFLDPGR